MSPYDICWSVMKCFFNWDEYAYFFFFLLLQREAQSWDKGQKGFGDPPVQRLHHTGAGTGTVQFGQTSINFGFSVC